jgi:hypothetical protein
LQTHIETASGSLCARMKNWVPLVNLNRQFAFAADLVDKLA